MPVTSYSRTPASNNAAPPNGAPEGWAPSAVNDTIRQIMTDIVNEASKGRAKVLGSVSGTDTITAAMSPALDAYTSLAGTQIVFIPAGTNTGAATLNIDSLGALDIQKFGGTALVAGDLVAGIPAFCILDGGSDDWILLNPIASTAKYADATANFTGTLQYGGFEVGYRGIRQRRDVSATGSTAASDAGGAVRFTASGFTFTIDTDIPDQGVVTLINDSTGNVTIAASTALYWANGSGSLPSSGSRTLAAGGVATVYAYTTGGNFFIWGAGLS